MEIIDAGPDDPLIHDVARTLNAQWGAELGYGVGDTIAWCRDVAASSTQCVLIAVGLWVAPSHRRAGLGTQLIEAVADRARQLDREELFLYCRAGGLADFYQKRGMAQDQSNTSAFPRSLDHATHVVVTKRSTGRDWMDGELHPTSRCARRSNWWAVLGSNQ